MRKRNEEENLSLTRSYAGNKSRISADRTAGYQRTDGTNATDGQPRSPISETDQTPRTVASYK